ncbi:DUF1353 domain-containing protein [Streptomyces sp. enrichment culture]|uniref:DUF1353 domain-containing protein n=1 Tax=Streptomyces sp. enrichment culture TaxID=1795815 RepID=UPI003F554AAD
MPFVDGNIAVKQIDAETWELLEEVAYRGREDTFTVPVGFRTDFASVPTVFVWLIPRYGVYTKAAIVHDYLCREAPVSRAEADGVFRRALRELGVSLLRRWIMWAAVRAGGRLSGTGVGELLLWLLVTVPAVAFLAVPAVVLTVWLALFWVLEWIAYAFAGRRTAGRRNEPSFIGAPRSDQT